MDAIEYRKQDDSNPFCPREKYARENPRSESGQRTGG
jgi:hypothetical protein